MYVEAKPTLEASMEEHEKVEKDQKARLKEIEDEKLAAATASAKNETSKASPKSKAQKK